MDIQREISLEKNEALVGSVQQVLIDKVGPDYMVGRTEFDSPEVDNEVYLNRPEDAEVGQFVQAKITDASEYDLHGVVVGSEGATLPTSKAGRSVRPTLQ